MSAPTLEAKADFLIEAIARATSQSQRGASVASVASWPAPIAEAAYHGLAGEVVRTIEPHTEADPVALLVQFLAAFGSCLGRGPHYQVEGDAHHANLYAVLVGDSSKARKGTSWGAFGPYSRCWTIRGRRAAFIRVYRAARALSGPFAIRSWAVKSRAKGRPRSMSRPK